jgi:hypothetical protein
MANELNQDSIIQFNGKRYSMVDFAEEFAGGDLEVAIGSAGVLVHKGKARLIDQRTKEQKVFDKVDGELSITEAANKHDAFVEKNKDYQVQKKREGRATYPCVEYDFGNDLYANEFAEFAAKEVRVDVDNIEIAMKSGYVIVRVFNVTDRDMNILNTKYKADKATRAAIGLVDSTAQKATDLVHYGATKVAAPMIQVGARAGASIFKTILTTAAKTASTLVTAGTQGVKAAAHEIRNDEDVLRAGRELIEVKDAAARKINGFGTTSGGRIVQ